MWCGEWPNQRVGVTKITEESLLSTCRAMAVTISVSVVSGKCGPCCSKLPKGITTAHLEKSMRFTSGHFRFSRSILPFYPDSRYLVSNNTDVFLKELDLIYLLVP